MNPMNPKNPPDPPLILIAEDDPSVRSAIADALESDGYAVRSAADGAEALSMAAAAPAPLTSPSPTANSASCACSPRIPAKS